MPDPIFGKDVGFYLFRLPFYQLLQGSLVFLTELAIVAVAFQYVYLGLLRSSGGRTIEAWRNAVPHLSVLLFILAATFGWGFYLDRYDLLYSTMGVVYGVGYTADHVTMIALWIMIGVSAVACALLVLNFFRPRWKAMAIGAGAYVALYIIGIVLVPTLFQKFVVQPNELSAGNSLFEELHRVHAQCLQTRRDPGNVLPGAEGPNARRDCQESRHHSKHSPLGYASAASDL